MLMKCCWRNSWPSASHLSKFANTIMQLFKTSAVSDLFESLIFFQIEPVSRTRFASTSNDNIVRMWEMPEMFTIRQHGSKSYVYALMYDEDKNWLLVGNGEGEVEVLDSEYNQLAKHKLHTDLITSIRRSNGNASLVVTGSIDTFIKVSRIYSTEVLVQL